MNTPTPRTDALEKRWNQTLVPLTQEGIDLARQLEQELSEARKRVDDLESNNRYQRGYDAGEKSMQPEIDQLRNVAEILHLALANDGIEANNPASESARTRAIQLLKNHVIEQRKSK